MKSKIWYNLKQILIILGAALAAAVSIELLLLPSNVVVGGASGIASILDILLTNTNSAKWYFSVGVWVVAVNIPILIYTFVRFRKRFAVKTLLYVVFLAAFLLVFRICNLAEIFKKSDGRRRRRYRQGIVCGNRRGAAWSFSADDIIR